MARDSDVQPLSDAIQALKDHDHAGALAEATSRVLLSRAEDSRKQPHTAPDTVSKLAEEHDLDKGGRATKLGDPFAILEHGPKNEAEAALLGALLARGVAKRIEEGKNEAARREVVADLLVNLDWLAATTALNPYQALGATLDDVQAELFWNVVATQLVSESSKQSLDDPTLTARRRMGLLVRATALAHAPRTIRAALASNVLPDISSSDVRRVALASLAGVDDPEAPPPDPSKTPAVAVRAASAARAPRLDGEFEGALWGFGAKLIAAITGILLIRWLVQLFARYLMGYRRKAKVDLGPSAVTVEEVTRLLGREVRQATHSHSLRSLRSGGIVRSFRTLHLFIGAAGLVGGAALGANFMVEGALSGYPPLALFGLAVIGGGILLDFLLEVLVPNKRGVCTLSLDFGRRNTVRLRGVNRDKALAFVKELEQLIPALRET